MTAQRSGILTASPAFTYEQLAYNRRLSPLLPSHAPYSHTIPHIHARRSAHHTVNMAKVLEDIASIEKEIRRARADKDLSEESKLWNVLGNRHMKTGSWREAVACYKKDYAICKRTDDVRGLMTTCQRLGEVLISLRDMDAAAKYLMEQLSLAQAECDLLEQQRAQTQLGNLHFERYLDLEDQAGCGSAAADALARAEEHRRAALDLATEGGASHDCLADAYNNLGMCYAANDNRAEARRLYEDGLKYVNEEESARALSRLHNSMGDLFMKEGNYERALHHMNKDVEICRQQGLPEDTGKALLHLGNLYRQHEAGAKALKAYREARTCFKQLTDGGYFLEAVQEGIDGVTHEESLRSAVASMRAQLAALPPGDDKGDPRMVRKKAGLLEGMVRNLEELKKWDQMLSLCPRLLRLLEPLGDSRRLAAAHEFLGNAYFNKKKHALAAAEYERGVQLFHRVNDAEGQARCAINLGNVCDGLQQYTRAEQEYKSAIEYLRHLETPAALDLRAQAAESLADLYDGPLNQPMSADFRRQEAARLRERLEAMDSGDPGGSPASLPETEDSEGDPGRGAGAHWKVPQGAERDRARGDQGGRPGGSRDDRGGGGFGVISGDDGDDDDYDAPSADEEGYRWASFARGDEDGRMASARGREDRRGRASDKEDGRPPRKGIASDGEDEDEDKENRGVGFSAGRHDRGGGGQQDRQGVAREQKGPASAGAIRKGPQGHRGFVVVADDGKPASGDAAGCHHRARGPCHKSVDGSARDGGDNHDNNGSDGNVMNRAGNDARDPARPAGRPGHAGDISMGRQRADKGRPTSRRNAPYLLLDDDDDEEEEKGDEDGGGGFGTGPNERAGSEGGGVNERVGQDGERGVSPHDDRWRDGRTGHAGNLAGYAGVVGRDDDARGHGDMGAGTGTPMGAGAPAVMDSPQFTRNKERSNGPLLNGRTRNEDSGNGSTRSGPSRPVDEAHGQGEAERPVKRTKGLTEEIGGLSGAARAPAQDQFFSHGQGGDGDEPEDGMLPCSSARPTPPVRPSQQRAALGQDDNQNPVNGPVHAPITGHVSGPIHAHPRPDGPNHARSLKEDGGPMATSETSAHSGSTGSRMTMQNGTVTGDGSGKVMGDGSGAKVVSVLAEIGGQRLKVVLKTGLEETQKRDIAWVMGEVGRLYVANNPEGPTPIIGGISHKGVCFAPVQLADDVLADVPPGEALEVRVKEWVARPLLDRYKSQCAQRGVAPNAAICQRLANDDSNEEALQRQLEGGRLDLSGVGAVDVHVGAVLNALGPCEFALVEQVDLHDNNLTNQVVVFVEEMLQRREAASSKGPQPSPTTPSVTTQLFIHPDTLRLDLSGNHLSASGVARMLQCPRLLGSLDTLDLSYSMLTDAASCHLARLVVAAPMLRSLKLCDCGISGPTFRALATGLPASAPLTELCIGHNSGAGDGVAALMGALTKLPGFATLDLSAVELDEHAMSALGTLASVRCLQSLLLPGTEFGDAGAQALCAPWSRPLGASSEGSTVPATPAPCPRVSQVNVALCGLSAEGASLLCETFLSRTKGLTALSLRGNALGPRGAKAVASLLRAPGCRLKELDLGCCGLGYAGMREVVEAVPTGPLSSLADLRMDENKDTTAAASSVPHQPWDEATISRDFVEPLRRWVTSCRTLAALNLDGNGLSDAHVRQLGAAWSSLQRSSSGAAKGRPVIRPGRDNYGTMGVDLMGNIAEPSMAAKIARRMRKFHDLHVPQLKGEAPRIFGVLREYIKDVLARQLGSVLNGEQLEAYHRMHVESMHAEVDALEAIWRRRGWPLLYCHNDLLPFNIMFDAAKDEVQFIDFEYGGYNPRGYDLGYHFCEYCGMDNDFSRYPSKSEQVHFIRNYLAADGRHEVTAEEVESLYLESNLMALAAHLFVALWYLGQVDLASSGGDVDFFTMAVKRFSAYFRQTLDLREEAELAKRSLNVIVKNLKMEEGENSEKLARAFEREILDRMGLTGEIELAAHRLPRARATTATGAMADLPPAPAWTKAGQPVYWKGAAIYVGHKPWQATPSTTAAPATPAPA
eukprot:jgi/Mesvir1/20574/Mv14815-RA.1